MGGFGSAVMEMLEQNKLHEVRVMRFGFPDKVIEHASQSLLLAKYGLDGDGIFSRVKEFVESKFKFMQVY
jgi:1-deoxy-D-xylulose-5-phosphate synthase